MATRSPLTDTLRQPSWISVSAFRTLVKGRHGLLSIAVAVTYGVFEACRIIYGSASVPAVATRILSALWVAVFAMAFWVHAEPRVLRMLIFRPRVLYFTASVIVKQCLVLVSLKESELFSETLLSISTAAAFLILPFADSVPPTVVSIGLQRIMAFVALLPKAYFIVWCRADPSGCHELYRDFKREVTVQFSNATTANASSNATRHQERRSILSTLDVMVSCDSVIAVLTLQALLSSIVSPTTTNVVRQPFRLSELHNDSGTPGRYNVCTKVFGQGGTRLETFFCKTRKWLLLAVAVCMILNYVWNSVPLNFTFATCAFSTAVIVCLCLNVYVLQKLIRNAGAWYLVGSVMAGAVSHYLIYGPRFWIIDGRVDVLRQSAKIAYISGSLLGIIIICACLDAVPPRLLPARYRMAFALLIFIYNVYLYVMTKVYTAAIYEGGPVPEFVSHVTGMEETFVQLSSLDVLAKSYVVVALLAMNAVYRAWRFPDEATLLQAGLSFAELHSNALSTQHSSVLVRDTEMTMKHNSRREPESAQILSNDD